MSANNNSEEDVYPVPSRRARLTLISLAAAAALLLAAAADAASGPTASDFTTPPGESGNWILPAGSYSGNRFIKQDELTPSNVDGLKEAWQYQIPDNSPIEASPIAWDGMVYLTSAHDHVYALDSETGKLQWKFDPEPVQLAGFPRNRGVAILDGKVFIGTLDGHLIALDAKTGEKVWDKQTVHNPKNSFYSMQPVPYKGMLLMGVSNGDWGGIGNISAFDPANGERIWQWDTVPKPGEPGSRTWSGDSWKRGGAAIWNGMAIDPETDTLFVDLGNPQPDFLGKFREGDNLYSDSMVALDISGDQPKLKWYYQFIPHDTHDWDPAMPPVLFQGTVNGEQRELVAAGDKAGNFWVLDASNGDLVHHTPVSFQYHQDTDPSQTGNYACPNTNGGVEYNGGAYDPATNTFFVPSINQCGKWKAKPKAVYVAGQFYLGGSFPAKIGPNWGWFNAVNIDNGLFSWREHLNLPANGGALVMSTGSQSLVFSGELSGRFDAFDAKTGERLWQYDTGASIIAPPSTYMAGGKRYVIVASGQPGFLEVPKMKDMSVGSAVVTAFTAGGGGESSE